jgi:small subunit ribosomal protein S5
VAKDVLLSKHAELALSSAPVLTAHPAFAVELNLVNSTQPRKHLGEDQSVAQLLKQTQVPAPLCTQRNALLKLAQHSDLVPVLKRLRPTASSTEGEAAEDTAASAVNAPLSQRLFGKAAAYRPLVRAGGTEYDNSPSLLRQQQVENSLLLSRVARQEETHSVAVRYQLLRNEFERFCAAAVAANDASVLLLQSHGQNVKDINKKRNVVSETNLQVAQELITQLIELKNVNGKHQHHKNKHNNSQANSNKDAKSEALLDQLFHLFLRRSDKIALAEGVAEYILLDGVPISGEDAMTAKEEDEEVEGDEVISDKLPLETSHVKDLKKQFSNETSSSSSSSSSPSDSGSESNDVDASTIDSSSIALTATSTDDEQQKVSLFSALQLRDEHGYVWHGTVLDTDMVQKTMPGKRIASHRALVVVGNMRGTAGFGSGKGKTPALAVEAAFRAALKKLSHIDLYENTGLAHDCFGQHNSCRAYVTATPPSRLAVASPFAEAVLNAFGIGSASVKLVGRRNPYSMVNAMFNALGKHENIDEYAKRRGKRYLTLKWLKEQKV